MSAVFPSFEWLQGLEEKLNNDESYARIARNWEGDMACVLEADDRLSEKKILYLDLWHGKCREIAVLNDVDEKKPAFVLTASYTNFLRVLQGDLDPMQAMLTRKLGVKGNMAVMMRSVPTVLDFVRCAREVTDKAI
jgi:putative sterol carrier protein